MYFLFKMGIFHCYVCLPEGNQHLWEESSREGFLVARICLLIILYMESAAVSWDGHQSKMCTSKQFPLAINIFPTYWNIPQTIHQRKTANKNDMFIANLWIRMVGVCLLKRGHFLVGVWTTPFEKYARQNGFIFPNFRGEHKKIFGLPPPSFPLNHDYLYFENQCTPEI